jgi:GT2 family glycosyltransferase
MEVKMAGEEICAAICTRDRPEQLRRALQSLIDQKVRPAEILVVDNAPGSDAACRMVREEFPTVRYVRESVPGLDFARNRALGETSREIVAFIDDDVVAAPDWVAATQSVFDQSRGIGACTGKVEALMLQTEGQKLFEANGGFGRGDRRIRLPADARRPLHGLPAPLIAWSVSVGSGCSLAVRRRAVLALGGFDEALDMGPALPGGGDLDILWRMLEAGYEIVYEPAVHAWHEHRREVDAVIHQILEHNRSVIAMLTKTAASARGGRRVGVAVFLLWRLVKPGARLLRRLVGRDPLPAKALVRMWWSAWRGLGSYASARRLMEKRRAGNPGSGKVESGAVTFSDHTDG